MCRIVGDLSSAKLLGTNLSHANLFGTNLSHADLSLANLSKSIIINSLFNNVRISDITNFSNAVIDEPQFIDYISKFTTNIPPVINNKNELKLKLKELIKDDDNFINNLLMLSKLPE
jgi:hypothetical protein